MTQYVIGIDGGGSRSRLAAIDKDMKILGRSESGPTNISTETYEGVFFNIQNLLSEFCANSATSLQNCLAICIGSAGASTGENAKMITQIFRDIGYAGKLKVMNDAELVLLTETNDEPGAIIISGTGSVGYAVDKEGTVFRAGGWGHIIDDGGSGYRIGMDAIKAALMDFDGRGEKTLLTKMVEEFFGDIRLNRLTSYIYGNEFSKAKIAEIAMLVRSAASQGDSVALGIELQAAKDLLLLARSLIKLACLDDHKIVLSGSILLHNENIHRTFECELRSAFPEMQIVRICEGAEIGAAHLAMRHYRRT